MSDNKNKINLRILADKTVLSSDQPVQRILEIKLSAPEINPEKKRPSLNLSLVIDRSGSMGGEKIHFARQAAAHVIDLLDASDRASVTIYDDSIETLFPSQTMTPGMKQEAKSRIMQVHSRGSTNLGGGWLNGCEVAARGALDGSFNRTLLLSDGLANVGITSIEELSMHARELNQRGISTSTFGIGLDYDEHLMEAMANSGGGNFYFLEALPAIPHVFEREFEDLKNTSLRDVRITMRLPEGIKASVSGGWQTTTDAKKLEINAGSLYAGREQSIYITLEHDAGLQGAEISVPVIVRAKDGQDYLVEESAAFTFKLVPASEEKAASADKLLLGRFAEVDMADKANEALKRERAGDRVGSQNIIRNSVRQYQDFVAPSTSAKYTHMANQMGTGLREVDRKRYHRQSYDNKQSRLSTLDYPLRLVNGYPIALIDGKYVLIDTGSPVTIGDEPEWFFLNELRHPSQDLAGVNAAFLSREVGTRVDILMGTDIMQASYVTLDLQAGLVHFSQRLLHGGGMRVPFKSLMGTPICTLEVAGRLQKMIIDTGAALTYVDKALAAGAVQTGTRQDFYPTIGRFETPVYELPVTIGGEQLTIRCGVLPPLLQQGIRLTGADGILGTQLYEHFIVTLAYPDGELILLPY